jgi:hypothetical protein
MIYDIMKETNGYYVRVREFAENLRDNEGFAHRVETFYDEQDAYNYIHELELNIEPHKVKVNDENRQMYSETTIVTIVVDNNGISITDIK